MRIGCVDVPIEIQAEPIETFISTPEILTEPDSNLQIKVDLELTQWDIAHTLVECTGGFPAYVSKASNANCVKHSQFGKEVRDPTIFHVEGKFTNRYEMELMM